VADLLETIELESGPGPVTAIIWMHGLGADGNDFVPIVPELELPASLPVRFVFPHAPVRPVSVNQGMRMRAWYDVKIEAGVRHSDVEGVRASARQIEALIARERERGVAAGRLFLAGFSQGGAMALHTGLRHAERLAGIIALSTSLPLPETVAAEAAAANRDTPIFMAHGTGDPMIPLERGETSRDTLQRLGYAVEWHQYRMPHSVCEEEIAHVSRWIQERAAAAR
jgi:phospholipase/carboxylesterase